MNSIKNIEANNLVPTEFFLSQNYPNPFSDKTVIKYCVAHKTRVRLEVFDSENNLIKKLVDEEKEAGTYEVEFSACDFPEGTYLYQMKVFNPAKGGAGEFLSQKKMIIQRSIKISDDVPEKLLKKLERRNKQVKGGNDANF